MNQLFTISGRYASTEDVLITSPVGYGNKSHKKYSCIVLLL